MSNIYEEDISKKKIVRSFQFFFQNTTAGGILLIIATVIAMVWANSPWHDTYHHFWHMPMNISFGSWHLFQGSLGHFINDGLMVVFFFFVGLEIKRELLIGELSSVRKAMLPIFGAIGGVVFPILIYTYINWGDPIALNGKAIPMATDIAFALGILALLGPRVPIALKVFLAALAIVDDLMAVLVIAIFYGGEIQLMYLLLAGIITITMFILNRAKVNKAFIYAILAFALWYCFLESGVHATVAGVVAAFTIPSVSIIDRHKFVERTGTLWNNFKHYYEKNYSDHLSDNEGSALEAIKVGMEKVQSPLHRMEHKLYALVSFVIMPVFALANAGVYFLEFTADAFTHHVTLGIILGLFFGKIIGVTLFSWLAVKLKFASLPEKINFVHMLSVSILCGIGFTMALFVSNLSFPDAPELNNYAKVGILIASILAAFLGYFILRYELDHQGKKSK